MGATAQRPRRLHAVNSPDQRSNSLGSGQRKNSKISRKYGLTRVNLSARLRYYVLGVLEKWSVPAFIMALAAAIIFAVLGLYAIGLGWQQTADQVFSSPMNVRFSHEEAGHSLVGRDWSSAKEH